MSKERIKSLLAQLREEIRTTDVDDELQKLMGELDKDIEKEIEADFASNHPTAERFGREVIDALVRMGI